MATLDVFIVVLYFVTVIGMGFWYARRAAHSLEDYFLGGKRMHWLALAMSGSVSNFDITGTMWIVSIIFLLGMKSMWHHWMWGVLMGAFFLAYMGKWVHRSKVMTAAEWMKTRFGDGPGGRTARVTYALMAVLTQASFIGYAYQGIGKFASVYIPLEDLAGHLSSPLLQNLVTAHESDVLAIATIGITTLYVLLGGLYSVVVTDVIQTVVLTVASVFIAVLAWSKLTPDSLAALPDGFASLRVPWHLPEFAGTDNAQFEFFGLLVIVWVIKGLLLNAGGPAQLYDFQRFLAARDERDACKIGAAWSIFLIVRWGMTMGIAMLALTGVAGVTDPEQIMPVVLRDFLPAGVRGLVIAGLLAAFMSTFSSTLNSAASFIVCDIWKFLIKPDATHRESIRMSYAATVLVVLLGVLIGFQGTSIAKIWGWIMMALGAGIIVPNVLRWYWWRFNGWGYAAGTLGGMLLSILALLFPALPVYVVFPIIIAASLAASIAGTACTAPVDRGILVDFFNSVRPFGWWGPVRKECGLAPEELDKKSERASLTALNTVAGMAGISAVYLFPMYLVGHMYAYAGFYMALAAGSAIFLKFTWYDNLPPAGEGGAPEEEPT